MHSSAPKDGALGLVWTSCASTRCSFRPLQKPRHSQRSYVWTEALTGMSSCRRKSCQIKCEYNLDRLTIILRSCQCNAGYEGSGTFCSEINPCTKPSRGGCHHEAVCTMTGPGANNCTCQDGFRGDGVVCVAIDPCQEKGAGYCHSNAECRYIGPGQVSL